MIAANPRRGLAALLLVASAAGCGGAERDLVLLDVSVVDVAAGRILPHRNVEIDDGRIVAVTEGPIDPAIPAVRSESLAGSYLMPGLWDMHVHALWDDAVADAFLPRFTRAGITGIRDMGGSYEVLARVRSAPDPTWPRIAAAGRVLDGPRPIDPSISEAAGNAIEARAAVQRIRHGGGEFLKVYTLLPRDAFLAAAELAAFRGMQVVGHVPADLTTLEAAEAGLASIEHLRDGQGGLCAGATEADCEALPGRLAELGTHVTPTLVVIQAKTIPGYVQPTEALDLDELPGVLSRYWRESAASQRRRGEDYFSERRRLLDERMTMVGRLHAAGVPILVGTDTGTAFQMPGASLQRELAMLVASGLAPSEALRAATLGACRFLGREDCGQVAPGYAADLVVLGADPLGDIANVRRVVAVVRNGEWLMVAESKGR